MRRFDNLADAQTLALAIVDTFPEPFLVLDDELRVLAGAGLVAMAYSQRRWEANSGGARR